MLGYSTRAVAWRRHGAVSPLWPRQVRSQTANPVNAYWTHVGVTMAQFDGIVAGAARLHPPARPPTPTRHDAAKSAGYNAFAPAAQQISYDSFLAWESTEDVGDIYTGIGEEPQVYEHVVDRALRSERPLADSHCSGLVKVTADGQHLFASHVTWTTFSNMLRTFKHYNYNLRIGASGFSFSSCEAPR